MDYFPSLYTPRLILRKLEVDDFPLLIKYANNKKIADRITNMQYPYEEPQAVFRMRYIVEGFKQKSRYVFAISLQNTEEFVGEISIHLWKAKEEAEIGYWLAEPFWGNGYATEAIGRMLRFAFEKLEIERLIATTDVDNIASAKALQKNGMKKESTRGKVELYAIHKPQNS
ncbi:MAG: GNAT family N-acetyltransferase [Bacteroidota bacterium]